MMSENKLHVSLEEFGLSKYESRAYVALMSMGTVSASELAYYAEIPRPKVYPTLLKLEKKKLVVTSKSKPITCTATSPEDAFDGIINDQINKVNAMNSLVSDLKRISEENRKSRGSEEGRYSYLSARGVLIRLKEMIQRARSSIWIMVDQSGLGLLSECREEILSALRRDVDVRMIIPQELAGSDSLRAIPGGLGIRISEISQNCIMLDEVETFMVNSDTGKGAIFSTDVLASGQKRMFSHVWERAADVSSMSDLKKSEMQEICRMVRLVSEDALCYLLGSRMVAGDHSRGLLDMMEANGIRLRSKTLEEVTGTVDSILHMTCRGHADLNDKSRAITVESGVSGWHSLPWVAILEEYLHSCGHKTRIAYRDNPQKGERVYIKIF